MIDLLRHLDPRRLGTRTHALGGTLIVIGGTMLAGGALFSAPAAGLATGGVVVASAADNNGDFWVQNVGNPANHEDPTLDCADIDLWGSDIAVDSSTYEVDLYPPSGSAEVYSSTWTYDPTKSDPQVLAVIPVSKLMGTATSDLHFKIDLPVYPSKHKTFWVDCSSSSTTTSTSTSTTTTTSTTSSSQSTSTQDTDTSSTDSSTSSDSNSSSSSSSDSSSNSNSSSSSTTSTASDPSTTSSSSTSSVAATSQTQSQSSTTSSSSTSSHGNGVGGTGAGTPPPTGNGTTTTSSPPSPAPTTSTGTSNLPSAAAVFPEVALSVPSAGADVPFLPGFLLILAGGALLACRPRRRKA